MAKQSIPMVTGRPEVDAQIVVVSEALRELQRLGWWYMLVVPRESFVSERIAIISNLENEGKAHLARGVIALAEGEADFEMVDAPEPGKG